METFKKEKLDIVVMAGQSNAEGFGKGIVTKEYEKDERILWMVDDANPKFVQVDGKAQLELSFPAKISIEVADEPVEKEGKVGKLSLFFAKQYKKQRLDDDRKILIIHAAVGGTGFARNEWGVGGVLYVRLVNMVKEALALNPENRIVAFLWHQGECDTVENQDWSPTKRYQRHKENLMTMIEDFKSTFELSSLPFVAGGFCDEWYMTEKEPADAVLHAIRECCTELGGAFVETSGLLSNNQKTGNGDNIHFCREALHILGKKYFDEFIKIDAEKGI